MESFRGKGLLFCLPLGLIPTVLSVRELCFGAEIVFLTSINEHGMLDSYVLLM
jgi:hypothetical protein